jgi:hypothetical protein
MQTTVPELLECTQSFIDFLNFLAPFSLALYRNYQKSVVPQYPQVLAFGNFGGARCIKVLLVQVNSTVYKIMMVPQKIFSYIYYYK